MADPTESWHRILFNLEVDDDGWPPAAVETVWALRTEDGHYEIRNIPFFISLLAWGDVVAAHDIDGMLTFATVVRESGHSTIRVIVNGEDAVYPLRETLHAMGCTTEQSHLPRLFTTDVPPDADLPAVLVYFRQGRDEGRWELDFSCLDHDQLEQPNR